MTHVAPEREDHTFQSQTFKCLDVHRFLDGSVIDCHDIHQVAVLCIQFPEQAGRGLLVLIDRHDNRKAAADHVVMGHCASAFLK